MSRSRLLIFILSLTSALLLFACSDSGETGDSCSDDGATRCSDETTAQVCTDGEWVLLFTCQDGQVCEDGSCVVKPVDGDTDGDTDDSTVTDGDVEFVIPDGDVVEEEEVQRGCTHDRDCTPIADYYCEMSTNQCKRRLELCEACTDHAQCGFGSDLCVADPESGEMVCGRACYGDTDCVGYGTAFKCTSGQCTLDPTAVGDGTCCIDSHCADVPDKPVCNFLTHRCYAGCHDDLECPTNQVCAEGHCRDGCASSMDCPAGFACDPVTRQCLEGDCFDKSECPPENLCNVDTRECYPGCEDDIDCLGSNECLEIEGEKQCVERTGCRHTGDCKIGFWCNFDVPDEFHPDRGTCEISFGSYTCCACEEDAHCGDSGHCVEWNFGCEKKEDCGSGDGDYDCVNGKCVRMGQVDERENYKACIWEIDCKRRDDDGNSIGTYDCPRGFSCGKLTMESQSGTTETGICVMDCYSYCPVPEHPNVCGDYSTTDVCDSLPEI